MEMDFRGVYTALVTPFSQGKVDLVAFKDRIHFQKASGVAGLVVVGSTGEPGTLSSEERESLIKCAVETAGDLPVFVGTGMDSTAKTLELSLEAQDLGAQGLLVVTPFYNRPSQEGIFRHFELLCSKVQIPIILYHNPARTASQLESSTIKKIASLPGIRAIKEAGGGLSIAEDWMREIAGPRGPTLLSGNDNMTYPLLCLGAQGVVSVLSNLMPRAMVDLVNSALEGNWEKARELHFRLTPIFRGACIESNPIPIKQAMAWKSWISSECRLPLCPMTKENQEAWFDILQREAKDEVLSLGLHHV